MRSFRGDKEAKCNFAPQKDPTGIVMSTCLVTGGAGFIGSHLVEGLLAAGRSVRVLDDCSTGVRGNVPAGVELVVGDVSDPDLVRGACKGVEVVFHLAALASVQLSVERPAE